MDIQQSTSWIHDREEGEDEQVLQPKIKRKRSIRIRPRLTTERLEEKSNEKSTLHRVDSSQLPFQVDHKYESQVRTDIEPNGYKNEQSDSSLKTRRNLPTRKNSNTAKMNASLRSSRTNSMSTPLEDGAEHRRESWDGKVTTVSGTSIGGTRMSDGVQRRVRIYLYFSLFLL